MTYRKRPNALAGRNPLNDINPGLRKIGSVGMAIINKFTNSFSTNGLRVSL